MLERWLLSPRIVRKTQIASNIKYSLIKFSSTHFISSIQLHRHLDGTGCITDVIYRRGTLIRTKCLPPIYISSWSSHESTRSTGPITRCHPTQHTKYMLRPRDITVSFLFTIMDWGLPADALTGRQNDYVQKDGRWLFIPSSILKPLQIMMCHE